MIILGGFILGVVIGATTALRRGGRKLDALQYAAVFGILFAIVGLFIDIYLGHMM